MKYYIGIDLGGTNVRVAKVDKTGNIIQDVKHKSYGLEGPRDRTVNAVFECLDKIKNINECSGIGIGVPGPVDTKKKVMTLSSNLVDFEYFPLAQMIEERYDLPTYIDNDANVAGLAEAVLGAGKGEDIVYYLTHSTGIGGALIINGKVVSGKSGYAGEVANIIIDRNRPSINGLNPGAVESYASGTAIVRRGKELFGDKVKTAREVFEMFADNDPQAHELVDDVCRDFAQMMATIAHVVDPGIFVIGGGCSYSSDLYFPLIEKYYKEMVHPGMRDIKIVRAVLEEPGVLGAAMLARK